MSPKRLASQRMYSPRAATRAFFSAMLSSLLICRPLPRSQAPAWACRKEGHGAVGRSCRTALGFVNLRQVEVPRVELGVLEDQVPKQASEVLVRALAVAPVIEVAHRVL